MVANPERGEVDLVVRRRADNGEPHPEGDRHYVLRMRTHDVCAMEQRTGKSFGQLMDDIVLKNWTTMRECLFAFLQPYHSMDFPTPPTVNALLDEIKWQGAEAAITDLIVRNRPPKAKDGKANPRKAQVGTGASSTRADAASA